MIIERAIWTDLSLWRVLGAGRGAVRLFETPVFFTVISSLAFWLLVSWIIAFHFLNKKAISSWPGIMHSAVSVSCLEVGRGQKLIPLMTTLPLPHIFHIEVDLLWKAPFADGRARKIWRQLKGLDSRMDFKAEAKDVHTRHNKEKLCQPSLPSTCEFNRSYIINNLSKRSQHVSFYMDISYPSCVMVPLKG